MFADSFFGLAFGPIGECFDESSEDILFVFEMPIDGGSPDVALAGDPPMGGIRITFGDEFLLRHFDDNFPSAVNDVSVVSLTN